ncbi:MAG: IclR family transcriptional regulator [Pirellulales bacterium]|nr:IclR family transcriptional regulator [Pirellulales bacterium]
MSIAVLEKTFLVIEHLAESVEPLSLAVLTRQTALPKPTVHRIVQTLAKLGYVAQDESGRYFLTPHLVGLTQGSRFRDLKALAIPHMTRLHQQFNETVNLGILDGTQIRYLHVLETTQTLRIMLLPNAADEYFSTAVGRAIAAFLPESQLQTLLKSTALRPITPKTVKTKPLLQRILQDTRARGWAVENEETVLEVICHAVPILQDGYPVAAISITMPKVRATNTRCRQIADALMKVNG